MIQLDSVERDLLQMKADTLYKYGKKVEIAEEMFIEKTALKKRLEKILARLKTETVITKGWFRKKRQTELTERVSSKLTRAEKAIIKLEELKDRYISQFKEQREACGLYDHSFLDNFYHEKEQSKVNDQ